MKILPAGMQAHLDTGATTLCWCWKVTRADGTVMGFTDHDRDVTFDAVIYEAASGFTATEIQSSLGLSVDNLEVDSALSSGRIDADDLAAGRYDDADVEIWRVNWDDPNERVLMRKGNVGEVSRGELAFSAEVRGLAHKLNEPRGRVYQKACDADLGDARCGIDLDLAIYKGALTVTAVIEDRILTVSGIGSFDDAWFTRGTLTWTAGNNIGVVQEVRRHQDDGATVTVTLWQAAPLAVQTGDTATIQAGCDKTFETCKDKFANTDNFRGFPHMPGNDRAFSYVVGESGENDGGSFFN